ncbi:MAG: hypothetical protein IT303_19860 [Dehalococcoidia bacterium]|nr:hypothetical protein [Dehalococcoidia bacterium]
MKVLDFNLYLDDHNRRVARIERTAILRADQPRRAGRVVIPLREAVTVQHGTMVRGPWPEPPAVA